MLNKFNFKGHDVRVIEIDGAPWWVAKDVIRCLGLTHQNTTIHTSKLREDERRIVDRASISLDNRALFANPEGGPTKFTVVSESGLYKLIMRSDKPEAQEFQDWVTREVLPAIRKTAAD